MVFLRSQDGEVVLNMDNVQCIRYMDAKQTVLWKRDEMKWRNASHLLAADIGQKFIVMAGYSTKEGALMVLDEIVTRLVNHCQFSWKLPSDEEIGWRIDQARRMKEEVTHR